MTEALAPAPQKPWYFDRSRHVTGAGKCAYRRFLEYHSGPAQLGIRRVSQNIPLSTGSAYHLGVAAILLARPPKLEAMTQASLRQLYRPLIDNVIEDYVASASKSGLMDLDKEAAQYKIAEQACLVEGLLWGFIRVVLPRFLGLFEVLEVEVEDLLQYTEGDAETRPVVFMLRPDVLVRAKDGPYAGKIGTIDSKTGYRLDEQWEKQFQDSMQMATQGLGAELRLGERADFYYIVGACKGYQDRAKDPDTGEKVGPRRQRSPFTYAYHMTTGITDAWESQYEFKDPATGKNRRLGKDWQLKPVWTQPFPIQTIVVQGEDGPVTEYEYSNAEYWAWQLPESVLFDQFKLVGPFSRNQGLIDKFEAEAPYEEVRWQQRLTLVNDEGVPAAQVIPRSWNCFGEWGKACPYMPICYEHPGWEQLYEIRTPHHEAEARAAGMKVTYVGEDQEEAE